MKLKKFAQLFERDGFDHIDGYDDDDYYEDEEYNKLNSDDSDDNGYQDDMEHLEYLLREMFKNVGIDVTVTSDNGDIQIVVMLNKKERLRDVISVFSVANKLKKDILAQYDSEFDLWEDNKGLPMLTFNFYYGDGLGDSNTPF